MQHQVHRDLMKFVTNYMIIMYSSGIWIFYQITLTNMSIIIPKHVHGWIILQCLTTGSYYARGAQGVLPMRVGGATSQLDRPSLTPLSVARCG